MKRWDDDPLRFTPVEREVMALVGQLLTVRDIARRLHCSPRTVRAHIEHAAAKIPAAGRARDRVLVYVTRWAA